MKKLIAKLARRVAEAADPAPEIPHVADTVLAAVPPIGAIVSLRKATSVSGLLTLLPSAEGTVHAASYTHASNGEMAVDWPGVGLVRHQISDFVGWYSLAS